MPLKRKSRLHYLGSALMLSIAFCILDAAADSVFFGGRGVVESLLLNPLPHDFLRRAVLTFVFLLFGEYIYQRQEKYRLASERELAINRFTVAFETSPDSININRLRDGLYIEINQGFTALTGYTREDVIGRSSLEIEIWADRKDRQRLVEELAKKGAVENLEAKFRLKNGNFKTALMSARVVNYQGEPHILSITRDITERKEAEELLAESENRFRYVLEDMALIAVQLDSEGKINFCNDSLLNLTGRTREETLGRNWFDLFIPPERKDHLQNLFIQAVSEGRNTPLLEGEILTRAGEKKLIRWNNILMRDQSANITGVTKLGEDITERTAQKARTVRLAAAVEQAVEEIIITDAKGFIEYVNPAFINATGYSREEATGLHISALESERNDPAVIARRLTAVKAGHPWKERSLTRTRDGSHLLHETSIAPIREGAGIVGHIAARRDVTKEAEMEEHLIQAQKLEAIGTLAGGIAHDFNNILSAVIGYTDLARMRNRDEAVSGYLDQVMAASSRARDLVKQILAFSRQTRQEAQPIQPHLVVKEALKLLRASIPSTIGFKSELDKNVVIMADPTEFHRVVVNLCTNAYHAMSETGGVLTVELSAHAGPMPGGDEGAEGYCRLLVKDTGCGMTPEVKARIFDPFFTTRTEGKGTGMGLSVVHGLVSHMKGRIQVETEPGRGTAFEILIPLALAPSQAELIEAETPCPGLEHILFVDDEAMVADLASAALSNLGYRVTAKVNPLDALEVFRENPHSFDVMITDMTMPGMTGDALTAKVRAIRPDLPVILCTGYSEKMNAEEAKRAGIDEFLLKPVLPARLTAVVRKIIDERRSG